MQDEETIWLMKQNSSWQADGIIGYSNFFGGIEIHKHQEIWHVGENLHIWASQFTQITATLSQ